MDDPARRHAQKTPQQRKADEYANARASTATNQKAHRRKKPRTRAREHRRERRSVSQILGRASAGVLGADEALSGIRDVRSAATPESLSMPLTERLARQRERRTLRDLTQALDDGDHASRSARVRAVLAECTRTTRHGAEIAEALQGWLSACTTYSMLKRSLLDPQGPPARLRAFLAQHPDLDARLRTWIEACGVRVRPLDEVAVADWTPEDRNRWVLPIVVPDWMTLDARMRETRGHPALAGLPRRLASAIGSLRARAPWRRQLGVRVRSGMDLAIGIDARGHLRALPLDLKVGIARRLGADIAAALGRPLESREEAWTRTFWSVRGARAALALITAAGPTEAPARLAAMIDEWLGATHPPIRRPAVRTGRSLAGSSRKPAHRS